MLKVKRTFTAEEFFNYLLSFSMIYIWEGGDENNGVYIRISPKNLELIKRKTDYAILGEIREMSKNFQQEGGFVLTGNIFHCDILENGRRIEMVVQSDLSIKNLKIELLKVKT